MSRTRKCDACLKYYGHCRKKKDEICEEYVSIYEDETRNAATVFGKTNLQEWNRVRLSLRRAAGFKCN